MRYIDLIDLVKKLGCNLVVSLTNFADKYKYKEISTNFDLELKKTYIDDLDDDERKVYLDWPKSQPRNNCIVFKDELFGDNIMRIELPNTMPKPNKTRYLIVECKFMIKLKPTQRYIPCKESGEH